MGQSRQQRSVLTNLNKKNRLSFQFQRTKHVPFEFDCGGWVKSHQGKQTVRVFRMSWDKALNGQGEVTASDPQPKQGLTGWSSCWQPLESKCSCLHHRLSACTSRLEAPLTRFEVAGCPNSQVFRQEDNQRDFGCWLNCSNWRLNEFTEPEGRGWANEASPGGRRSHWEWGPQQPRCAGTLQGILQFLRKED